jgi:hypothetical protein
VSSEFPAVLEARLISLSLKDLGVVRAVGVDFHSHFHVVSAMHFSLADFEGTAV